MDKVEQLTTQSDELLREIFLHGHSEGWTGNQTRRDVKHVDAEKGWSLYVSNGALEKTKALHRTTSLAAQEALAGYRAAVSFISADSWDGCSDCINILKAARCADMTDAMTINETAEHLKRIRLHYDPAALPAAPSLAAQDGLVEALRVAREYVQNVVDAEGKAFNVRDLVQIDAALSAIKEQHHD